MSNTSPAGRVALAAFVVLGTASTAGAAAETLQDCATAKPRWSRALRLLEPARPDLAFVPVGNGSTGQERVSTLTDVDVRVTCLDGVLSRVELRQRPAGAPAESIKPLLVVAASVLIAFDSELTPVQAADMIAALRAEAETGRVAVSTWGLYEITYRRDGEGRAEFVVDHPEH